jgi:ribonuclease HI
LRQLRSHSRYQVKGTLHTDGGARGNPGPAGIGVVLTGGKEEPAREVARYIGEATNNVAEYSALIAGLELALDDGISEIVVYVDSELVVAQLEGRWKIKNDRLRALAAKARSLMDKFEVSSIRHVRRDLNARADELANEAMDAGMAAAGTWPSGPLSLNLDLPAEDNA